MKHIKIETVVYRVKHPNYKPIVVVYCQDGTYCNILVSFENDKQKMPYLSDLTNPPTPEELQKIVMTFLKFKRKI